MQSTNTNKKILLFSFERSGSTSLLHLLNNILKEELFHEPFNKYEHTYFDKKNTDSLQSALTEIKSKYPGFKHTQGQLTAEENKELLSDPDFHVIFLYRKNSYARVLSLILSQQANIWHNDRAGMSQAKKVPVKIANLEEKIASYETAIDMYKKFFQENNISYTEMTYESLFGESVSPESKVSILKEAFQSVRTLPEDTELLDEVKDFLSPKKKYNTQEIYRQIPNMKEIDETFGPQYGYILKKPFWDLSRFGFGFGSGKKK